MKTEEGKIIVPVEADISGFVDAMADLEQHSRAFGSAFSSTIKSAIQGGRSFDDLLKQLVLRLSAIGLSSSLRPLEAATSNLFQRLASGLTSSIGKLILPAGGTPNVTPFAKGGVVSSPTYFQSGASIGLMGEAGAEAILPLSKGADGRLGVRGDGIGQNVNVTFNVHTPDAVGFRKSEGRISAMLARSVSRGRRSS